MVNESPAVTRTTLPTLPALVIGKIDHTRREGIHRTFRHNAYQWLIDLDDIPKQRWYLRPFASFSSRDHLGNPQISIRKNVENYLSLNGIRLDTSSKVLMLANARILGHVFDPLTVFWCLDSRSNLICTLAEVRNTYEQRHLYLLHPDQSGVATTKKMFHVSPFLDMRGDYEMRFKLSADVVSTTVTLVRDGKVAFTARFQGRPVRATRRAILSQVISKPFMSQRVSILIRIHGIWLWLRRMPVFRLPDHDLQEGAQNENL
jgi:DUF1365 family protein